MGSFGTAATRLRLGAFTQLSRNTASAFATATTPLFDSKSSYAYEGPPKAKADIRCRGSGSGGGSSSTALSVQKEPRSLLQRTAEKAAETVHRLLMLVSSLRRMSANEAYVAHYLQQRVGIDSFAIEYLHVMRPTLFRLSVAQDIEPVISWLRSIGISGEELVELVQHTPSLLSSSVDEQLEPLAAFITSMGGSPPVVIKAYPGLAAVQVAAIKGTRHVLRQLGVADSDIQMMLLCLPHLYAQLALTLQQLFKDFAVAGWKLQARQRHQLVGAVHHHASHWSHSGTAAAAGSSGSSRHASEAEGVPAAATAAAEGSADGRHTPHRSHPQHSTHVQRAHRGGGSGGGSSGGHQNGGHLLSTSYLVDHEVYLGLRRVQSALEAVALQPDGEERYAAISFLEHAIEMLGELAGPQRSSSSSSSSSVDSWQQQQHLLDAATGGM